MQFFSPDTTFYEDYTDRGKYLLTWRLSLLFVIIFFALSATFISLSTLAFSLYFSVFSIALLGLLYLHKTKKYIPIFWSFTVFATLLNGFSLLTVTEVVHYAEFFWIITIVIFAFIGLGRTIGIWFILINAVVMSIHMLFMLNPNISVHRPHTQVELVATLIEILFAIFTIGYLLHQFLVFQGYAEQQLKVAYSELETQNQLIVKKNAENSMLAKEIHHRVKNNLQIVISLLRMHSDEVRSAETKAHFSEAINRIMTMSLIHQKLYQEKELSNIDVRSYLEELTQEILASSNNRKTQLSCVIESDIQRVGLKTIVPLGLLLNELMTNSVKHAFTGRPEGAVLIRFAENSDKRLFLEYSDNGVWKDKPGDMGGFGLELVQLLTSQLAGTYVREGSKYIFELENLDH